jgi:hypothetical protein
MASYDPLLEVSIQKTEILFRPPLEITTEMKNAQLLLPKSEDGRSVMVRLDKATGLTRLVNSTPEHRLRCLHLFLHWHDKDSLLPPDALRFTKDAINLNGTVATILVLQYQAANIDAFLKLHPPDSLFLDFVVPSMVRGVPILLKALPGGDYQISFHSADEAAIPSKEFRDTILAGISTTVYLFADLADWDRIDDDQIKQKLAPIGARFARLPTEGPEPPADPEEEDVIPEEEEEEDEPFGNATIVIIKDGMTADDEAKIKSALDECLKENALVYCRKCGDVYNSAEDDAECWEYFHTGTRIRFPDSGEMEEVEQDDEARILENWSCCGTQVKDALPRNCGRRENGTHERDAARPPLSRITFEKRRPND